MLIAHATKVQLESNGFEILGMARDEAGFLELISLKPDAILMDVMLKNGQNGIEIIRKLREQGNATSVVFTTGNSMNDTLEEIEGIVNACVLGKPVNYSELFVRIRQCYARGQ